MPILTYLRKKYMKIFFLTILMILCVSGVLSADPSMPGLLDNFWNNLGDAHWGWNLSFHLGAIGSTAFFINSGADAKVKHYFQKENPLGQGIADSAFIVGNFWHLVPAAIFYWRGRAVNDKRLAGAGAAGLQAVFSTFLANMLEKFMSGRQGPNRGSGQSGLFSEDVFDRTEDPNNFSFGFWNNSLSEGRFFWPSGHTSTAFSFAAAMTAYYPEKTWVPFVLYPLAAFMGVAMIEGDFHWFSDIVAGALMGHIIGWTIGKRYLRWYLGEGSAGTGKLSLSVIPIFNKDGGGLICSLQF